MTAEAKRILCGIFNEIDPGKNYTIEEITEEDIQVVSRFALQIAEKTVAEVLEEYDTVGHARPVIIAGRILNRIKTEIGGES